MDNKNLPTTEKDFELLNNICMSVIDETIHEADKDWTQDDINLFVSQFNTAYNDDPIIDMNKLDPNFIPYEDFAAKYSGFDDSVIQMLWECENKKLEDARIAPLRIKKQSLKLVDNLSNLKYIEDGEAESISKTASPTNRQGGNRRITEKEKEEEEEGNGEEEVSV